MSTTSTKTPLWRPTADLTAGEAPDPGGFAVASSSFSAGRWSAADSVPWEKPSPIFRWGFPWGCGPAASPPPLAGEVRDTQPSRAHCKGIVPAGTGFIMWPLTLRQCRSHARENPEGEEHKAFQGWKGEMLPFSFHWVSKALGVGDCLSPCE